MPTADEILATIVKRARDEYGDYATLVAEDIPLDGTTRVVDLADDVIEPDGLLVKLDDTTLGPNDYVLDSRGGKIVLTSSPSAGSTLSITGTSWQFFTESELADYVTSATTKHLHGKVVESMSIDANGYRRYARALQTVATLPPVEWHPVALLAAIEATYVLIADAQHDLSVSTAEGTMIPRQERLANLTSNVQRMETRYKDLSAQLNVGLWRIQVGDLRRVSRTTERLVPLYPAREIDDNSPVWERALPPRDYPATLVAGEQPMDVQQYSPQAVRGHDWETTVTFPFDISAADVTASITIGRGSRQQLWGQVLRPPVSDVDLVVTKVDAFNVTLSLDGGETAVLPATAPWRLESDGDPFLAGTFIVQDEP